LLVDDSAPLYSVVVPSLAPHLKSLRNRHAGAGRIRGRIEACSGLITGAQGASGTVGADGEAWMIR
jgi:hypothetical protein